MVLTPEEWVRQHVIHYLVHDKGYGAGLIAVEKSLVYNGLSRRFDLCVADSNGAPYILVECKAPDVKLSAATLQQTGMYLKTLGAPYAFITNGLQHVFLAFSDGVFKLVEDLPQNI